MTLLDCLNGAEDNADSIDRVINELDRNTPYRGKWEREITWSFKGGLLLEMTHIIYLLSAEDAIGEDVQDHAESHYH